MLTIEEYEKYKKKLDAANRELAVLEAQREQIAVQLKQTYGLTLDEAKAEVARLAAEVPKLEAEFEQKYKEFNEKWDSVMQKS